MLGAVAVLAVVAAVAWGGAGAVAGKGQPAAGPSRPNIVFVLTDDLSFDLLRHMPNVEALRRQGVSFNNYFVTDSLCCPSRATIFTGEYPHNTDVRSNNPPLGGYETFTRRHDDRRVFAKSLQQAGYRTGLIGKYLNGYLITDPPPPYWNLWWVQGSLGYSEYGYSTNANGTAVPRVGYAPQDYLTTNIKKQASDYIAGAKSPFFLEVSTFSPHEAVRDANTNPDVRRGYAVPAPRDDKPFQCLRTPFKVPRGPDYDVKNRNAPQWLDTERLTHHAKALLDARYCKRAQAVESVDRMIGALRRQIAAEGLSDNTYFIFNSDNGFHTGQHRLGAGKMTAFEEDIRVPLIVVGPGIRPHSTVNKFASNIDLAPTFDAMAGARVPRTVDGHSLLGLMHRKPGAARGWRTRIMVEHRHATRSEAGPDKQSVRSGNPPSYRAIRGRNYLYVQYERGVRGEDNHSEYYRLHGNPYAHEINNVYHGLSKQRKRELAKQVRSLKVCRGHTGKLSCWTRSGGR
jgi:N-acetylglucosamine-6-sulfatase